MDEEDMGNSGVASVLSDGQLETLKSVLDIIIPMYGEFPGAGKLGGAKYIDGVVGKSTQLKRLFLQGLAQVGIESNAMYKQEFAHLTANQRTEVLQHLESREPVFFDSLARYCYNFYYTQPKVLMLLGLDVRPPQPKGFQLEAGDFSLLEKVTKRGILYRET